MIGTIVVSPTAESAFVRTLRKQMGYVFYEEMELTIHVAVLCAMGYPRAEIVRRLDSNDIEIRMAMERLRRIAETWK